MKTTTAIVFVIGSLLFAGAGCAKTADKLAEDAVKPVEVSVEALGRAKELAAMQEARANEDAERESSDMRVAMIRTAEPDAAEVPAGPETIGCGDRIELAPVHRALSSGDTVKDALATLFSVKEATHEGLYNALWQSTFTVEDVRSPDGVMTEVRLKGEARSGGVCDDPRIKAQVEKTIARFRTKYKIILNGSERNWRCLGDMSGECK